jgi:hypothetical protein
MYAKNPPRRPKAVAVDAVVVISLALTGWRQGSGSASGNSAADPVVHFGAHESDPLLAQGYGGGKASFGA